MGHDDQGDHLTPTHALICICDYPLQARCPGRIQRRQTGLRTPLDVLTRASEAVAQGGTYTSVAKEFSIDRMKLKRFIRNEKLQGPATSTGYEYLSRLKSVYNDRQESDLAEHIKVLLAPHS